MNAPLLDGSVPSSLLRKQQPGPSIGCPSALGCDPGYPTGNWRRALGRRWCTGRQTAGEAARRGGVIGRTARVETRLEELGRRASVTTSVVDPTEYTSGPSVAVRAGCTVSLDLALVLHRYLTTTSGWLEGFEDRRTRLAVEVLVLIVAEPTVHDLAVDALAYVAVQAQPVLLELYLRVAKLVAGGYLLEVTLGAAAALVRRGTRRAEALAISAHLLSASVTSGERGDLAVRCELAERVLGELATFNF